MHRPPRGGPSLGSGTRFTGFTSRVGIAPTRWLSCREPKFPRLIPASRQLSANGSHVDAPVGGVDLLGDVETLARQGEQLAHRGPQLEDVAQEDGGAEA